uniref:Uncharacterized protein n=1 Tax=Chaetoceros debilis TaxID=122233 RepID=A0A7S3VC33_9STRA
MATSLARHLCEHIDYLSLGVQARILDTHDYLILFVPLVEEPPWTRRRKITVPGKGKGTGKDKDGEKASTSTSTSMSTSTEWIWEKLNQNREWTHTPPSTLLHLTQCEAQCWLAIFHLTCSKACRENRGTYHGYSWNTHRKNALLKLRKYLGGNGNDMLTDQLPILKDVMVFMDQLAIMNVPEHGTGSDSSNNNSGLLLQQVDRMREKIVSAMVKGRHDGGSMYASIFQKGNGNVTDATDMDLRLIAEIYNADMLGVGVGVEGGAGGGGGGGISNTSTSAATGASAAAGANLEAAIYAMSAPLKVIEIKSEFTGMGTGSGSDNGSSRICTLYNLTPANEGQVLKTECGEFRRTKLKLHSVNADSDADVVVEENDDEGYDMSTGDEKSNHDSSSSSSSHHFFNNASIQARVSFDGFVNLKTLTSKRMNLLNDNDNDDDNDENITSKAEVNAMKWFQLGTAEEGIVLQLGFKRVFASNNENDKVGIDSLSRFELRQGFLSQPHLQT